MMKKIMILVAILSIAFSSNAMADYRQRHVQYQRQHHHHQPRHHNYHGGYHHRGHNYVPYVLGGALLGLGLGAALITPNQYSYSPDCVIQQFPMYNNYGQFVGYNQRRVCNIIDNSFSFGGN